MTPAEESAAWLRMYAADLRERRGESAAWDVAPEVRDAHAALFIRVERNLAREIRALDN